MPRSSQMPSFLSLPQTTTMSPPQTTTHLDSRSERLLRDTLRRDDLAAPKRIHHARRHSNPRTTTPAHLDLDRPHPHHHFTAPTSPVIHRPNTTPRRPSRPNTASSAHGTDMQDRYSRPVSPSPSSRRESHDPSHAPMLTLTPHEQVLRTRLERVLQAGRGIARAESRDRERDRDRDRERDSAPPRHERELFHRRRSTQSGTSSSGPSDDCSSDDLWFFRDPNPTNPTHNPLTASPKSSFQDQDHGITSDPPPLTPPSPRSRSQSSSSHDGLPHQPLTPPPTPPLHATTIFPHTPHHARLVSSAARPSISPHTSPFNARTASAQCRQMEGYVSFASVEGLGPPPAGCDDEDSVLSCPGPPVEPKGRVLLGRFWRALGVDAAVDR